MTEEDVTNGGDSVSTKDLLANELGMVRITSGQYLKYEQIELYPSVIEELEIKIDLRVYTESSAKSDDNPTLYWIRYGDEIVICAEVEDDSYLYSSLKHTLFAPFTLELEEDNKKLHLLNQPLLEEALKSWERKIGSISEYDGFPKAYKYGFKSDEKWQIETDYFLKSDR